MAQELDVANTLIGFLIGGGGLAMMAKTAREIVLLIKDEKAADRAERKEIREADRAEEKERHDLELAERRAERELRDKQVHAITELTMVTRDGIAETRHAVDRMDALVMEIRAERTERASTGPITPP